ncbi:hypothetical protein EON65_58490 [archaeon]|nr:MAG: hypothetical protein EON65_58490 [archaeon]
MQRLLPSHPHPTHIDCVEIDPLLPPLAEKYFGFIPRKTTTTVLVMDAQDYIVLPPVSIPTSVPTPTPPLDFLILDLDSKDVGLGMTAPPPVFLSAPLLASMYDRLGEGGIALINVAARDPHLLQSSLSSLRAQFTCLNAVGEEAGVGEAVYVLQPSLENVNITVICLKTPPCIPRGESGGGGKGGKKSIPHSRPAAVQYRTALQTWIKVILYYLLSCNVICSY